MITTWLTEQDCTFLPPDRLKGTAGRELILPPLLRPQGEADALSDLRRRVEAGFPDYLLILIQAGAAALGLFEAGELVRHKVVRKYMVRQKQGKAQLTYLKRKGKSRAGSRIRLRESAEFFEEINAKLSEWWEAIAAVEYIFISCPVRLAAEWWRSTLVPPLQRSDPRVGKVPFDVKPPRLAELQRIHFLLASAQLQARD